MPYQQVSVKGLRLRLPELLAEDQEARKIRKQDLKDSWEENADMVIYNPNPLYIPEIVKTELISRYHDNPLAKHFRIDKIGELITQKYY